MSQGNGERHWARTSTLMWIMLAMWIIFSFVIHMFVNQLNTIKFLGFPLFWFAKAQDKIDREEGFAEDE